ncbi:MAG: thymidine phosphorylase [Gammaproteobacteria bacterium]|nr:thymidine phosphorylase [Gammaproteobacteria bacterium]
MLPQEIIRKKRNGEALDAAEIQFFVDGLSDGSIAAEQVSALAMAVYFQSMDFAETAELTRAMARSGNVIDWAGEGIEGLAVDKHSTGGVGDKVSLILAPLVAACGTYVPMISGRGLGHTGGTLDKLDSIPGYNTAPGLEAFKRVVASVGCAIIGQTPELAPADRRFYAIRDVTASVESVPLITASILSKKISAGLCGLVMDIKTGSGAFMETEADALDLARSIINTAVEAGLPARAVITDMSEVLGRNAGNALEVRETIDFLTGAWRDDRLHEVVFALAAEMLALAGIEEDRQAAQSLLQAALDQGRATRVFADMVSALGGPADLVERLDDYLPPAPAVRPVFLDGEGYIATIDVRRVGNAIVALGGGRKRVEDRIDHSVGLTDIAGTGARIDSHTPIAHVHARDEAGAKAVSESLRRAFMLTEEQQELKPVICKTAAPVPSS